MNALPSGSQAMPTRGAKAFFSAGMEMVATAGMLVNLAEVLAG